jgi:hypothetical protein
VTTVIGGGQGGPWGGVFLRRRPNQRHVCFKDESYVAFSDEFDPLVVVAHWLDACRWGELDALLNLYDERATLECDCERVSLTGRKWIAVYWAPKLESKVVLAFSLYGMALTADGVQVDYLGYEGNPVRMHFRFSPSGKILHTSCGPLER